MIITVILKVVIIL